MSEGARKGDWKQTYTGIEFYPIDPRAEEIRTLDIAHALSMICRFGGHSLLHYSVAQHSCLVASHLPADLQLAGLLHDAAEAYVGDMVAPLKRSMPEFTRIERVVETEVRRCFGLGIATAREHDLVKEADMRALATEARDVMGPPPRSWEIEQYKPFEERLIWWSAAASEACFVRELWSLMGLASDGWSSFGRACEQIDDLNRLRLEKASVEAFEALHQGAGGR